MKKLLAMIALAAITTGTFYATPATAQDMQQDTTKMKKKMKGDKKKMKMKGDTTKWKMKKDSVR